MSYNMEIVLITVYVFCSCLENYRGFEFFAEHDINAVYVNFSLVAYLYLKPPKYILNYLTQNEQPDSSKFDKFAILPSNYQGNREGKLCSK